MSNNPKRTARLSAEEKRALLAQLLQEKARKSRSSSPLSYIERSLWLLYQLAPESAAYHVAFAARIRSQVDIEALRGAFQALMDRHPVLRSTYSAGNGGPIRQIHEHFTIPFEQRDVSDWSEEELKEQMVEEAHRPFDLEHGPLMRVRVFTRSAGEHILLLAIHHIAVDLWSMLILMRELKILYPAAKAGVQAVLPPLRVQYTDYVAWQAKMLAGPEGELLWSYWQRQLGGDLPELNLPTDRPRPLVQTYSGTSYTLNMHEGLIQRLKALARAEGVTLYMVLLAAFQVLLARYTAQEDILLGSSVVGRSRSEFEGIVGCFFNPVPLRTDLSGNPTFRKFLDRVRRVVLDALEHQDCPSLFLVEQLQPRRDPSRPPLFQAMFTLDKAHRLDEQFATEFVLAEREIQIDWGGLIVEPFPLEHRVALLDLLLLVTEAGESFTASLQGNTDLFNAATLQRMLGHYQTLLESIVAQPDQRLATLPLLTDTERQQALIEWTDTKTDYPQEVCLHQLFEAQVERTPEAIAVVFEDRHLTYRELHQRANQLAHHLQALGVGPEVLVGICMERSLEMVVGILGVLKAGGAYVPLDPTYPQERLAFMLEDAQVAVLLTQQRLLAGLPQHGTQVICLDTGWETIAQEREDNAVSGVSGGNLAYVIYTSGSTGSPKGAMNTHRGICNRLLWMQDTYQLTEADRVLQKTPYSFDVSVWEFFWPLLTGARLIMACPGGHQDSTYLVKLIAEQKITTLHFVPSMLRMFLEERGLETCKSLRRVLCSGEALPLDLQERFFRCLEAELHNLYGPTEAAIDVTFWACQRDSNQDVVPIGRPIANTQIYILDAALQPVPVGVSGELHIGGVGLARGYLQQPDLTAEKFIPHPFGAEPGARLYKTGDLARYLADGNIEFIGRLDQQVKIRGFRIELGEIEAILAQHPAVREAATVVRENGVGEKRLVAYVAAEPRQAPAISELRGFLKQKLPEYMVPSTFVMLDTLPLTPSGKVNRRALPAPDLARPELDKSFIAPRTPTEEVLVGIWAQVLGVERVGIYDDFFELGGHSLLATQIISRMRQTFGVELPLRRLFETPTVTGLAQSVEAARQAAQGLSAPPLRPVPRDGDLPLSFGQQRLWFLDQLEPGSAAYNVPAAVRLKAQLNVAALEQSLNEVVRRHEVLRTTFATVEGQPVQIIAPSLTLTVPVIDLQALPEAERETEIQRLLTEEAQQPFDLARGPLLRPTLLQLSAEEYIVSLTMHHIVCDGWSAKVLVRELAVLYVASCAGQPSPLSALPVQYADFAHWQQQWLQGDALEAQLAYWKQRLAGAPPLLALPTDQPRPIVQTYRGATHSLALPKTLTEGLKALSRQEGVTLFMTLFATFQTLLHRYTGQEDIVVGTPIANRHRAETEGLVGFFVNTLALRTDLSGNPLFSELLKRVREECLEAYAHQDLPFEKLVEELQPERDLSRHPLFQVMFVLHNEIGQVIESPGLTLSPMIIDSGIAHFDLTLEMMDTEEGLKGRLVYNTDLFDTATIGRLLEHFQTLLESVVTQPKQRVSALPLLTEAERHQLLVEWNDTRTEYPSGLCIPQLFELQVEKTPDAVAVVFGDTQLTYEALNRRANQVAHYLQQLGVGPEVLVGICLERSLEMIVGLLGILKAGGAYVPLDPAYPQERLAFMLADAQAPMLLTRRPLVGKLPAHEAEVVCLDSAWESIAQESKGNLVSGATPENLAYVIYTSGSTGTPKGVAIRHAGLINLVTWHQRVYCVTPVDRATQLAAPAFDASVWEIWPYLTSGACLYIPDEETLALPSRLLAWLTAKAITICFLPTPLVEAVLEEQEPTGLALRVLLTGGDKLRRRPRQALPFCLANNYGPTEGTVVTTWATVATGTEDSATPPIGRPIANTRVYVLDRHLQPVPVGVPGELYIGGAGLARGYLNRPELTAESFIPNPFSEEPGTRLYKTGDLVRYLPDGNIEFLGRIDHQVKIRGFRIELQEIEVVLSQHAAVREAVTLTQEDVPGDKRLVAYVVPKQGQALTSSELRSFLKQKLPDYMVPSTFVVLDTLPLTPNGKVDRRALSVPDRTRPDLEKAFVAPRTRAEEMLTRIWAEVLGIEQVGVYDNFFELGGHSLQAVKLVSKISSEVHSEIPVKHLLLHPTIAGFADALERNSLPEVASQQKAIISKEECVESSDLTEISPPQALSPFLKIERRPLLSLFAAGKLAPVDAATLGYLPRSILEQGDLSREVIIENLFHNLPLLISVMDTHLGRIANILLPRFSSELYAGEEELVGIIVEALEIAGHLGARTVSLTGLIPSATDYGLSVSKTLEGRKDLPAITTGHATTVCSVVLSIRKILQEGGRDITQERVGFLGLGSIGLSSLRLMLKSLPHPSEIILCDVYSRRQFLQKVRKEIVGDCKFRGSVRIVESGREIPSSFYDSTFIIGATNVPDILDIRRVRPGTMIVDDSAPHCFVTEHATERFRAQEDVLFTEGGMLRSPQPIRNLIYLPSLVEQLMPKTQREAFSGYDPYQITGCVFSSLLSSCFEDLKPIIGFVEGSASFQHYERLQQLSFDAADLHCEDYVLPEKAIRNFRTRFGASQRLSSLSL